MSHGLVHPLPSRTHPLEEAFTQEVPVKLWAIAKLTPSKFHTYLPPARQGDYEFSMSHQPHPRGEPHPHPCSPEGTWMSCSPPQGSPETPQEPLMEEERISFFLLHVLLVSGPPWGDTGLVSHENRPIPARRPWARILSVMRAIPVPLLTVVSQSGEQTPPRHTQGF